MQDSQLSGTLKVVENGGMVIVNANVNDAFEK